MNRPWTNEELHALRNGAKEIPGRSYKGIWKMRRRLGILKRRENTSGRPYLPNLSPTPSLAYLLGALKGDGWVGIRKTKGTKTRVGVIEAKVTERDFAYEIEKVLSRIGLRPKLSLEKRPTTAGHPVYRVLAYSVKFAEWYTALNVENLRRYLGTRDRALAFLRGFYEAEGGYYPANSYGYHHGGYLAFFNQDIELLRVVKEMVDNLGFRSVLRDYKRHAQVNVLGGELERKRFLALLDPSIKGL